MQNCFADMCCEMVYALQRELNLAHHNWVWQLLCIVQQRWVLIQVVVPVARTVLHMVDMRR